MDLSGIGAIAAAVVAAVGIPAAMLVGRWQVKAAIRTAEETYRGALTQAESSYNGALAQAESGYRAALDAVRADALNVHRQWRRGVRREAYAAFLLAITKCTNATSGLIYEDLPQDERTAAEANAQKAAMEVLTQTWVIRLEGPSEISELADRVQETVDLLVRRTRVSERQREARTALEALTSTDTRAQRLLELLAHIQHSYSTVDGGAFTVSCYQELEEFEQIRGQVSVPEEQLDTLLDSARYRLDGAADFTQTILAEQTQEFLEAVRRILDSDLGIS